MRGGTQREDCSEDITLRTVAGGTHGPRAHPAPGPPNNRFGNSFNRESGFFWSLTDIRFTNFVTPKVASVVYVLAVALILVGLLFWAIASIAMMFSGEDGSVLVGLLMLVVSPFVALLYIILVRVSLEATVALVRVAEDVAAMRRRD